MKYVRSLMRMMIERRYYYVLTGQAQYCQHIYRYCENLTYSIDLRVRSTFLNSSVHLPTVLYLFPSCRSGNNKHKKLMQFIQSSVFSWTRTFWSVGVVGICIDMVADPADLLPRLEREAIK